MIIIIINIFLFILQKVKKKKKIILHSQLIHFNISYIHMRSFINDVSGIYDIAVCAIYDILRSRNRIMDACM